MQPQSSTSPSTLDEQSAVQAAETLLAGLPIVGRLRPATQACAMLAYARTSKSVQTSIPAQHEQIAKMARRHGVPITQKRQDQGKSGWRSDRTEYRRLLEDLASGEYSHLGLYKADRLARDSELLIGTVHACWRMGITVLDTTVGEVTPLNVHVLAMLAEMELRQLSERTTMGLEDKAKDRKLGLAPLGYKRAMTTQTLDGRAVVVPLKGQWVPDEDGLAPAIRELGARFAGGESLMSLARWFNQTTGRKMQLGTLRTLLGHEFYAGWVVNRKTRKSLLEGKPYARPKEEWSRPFRHPYPLWDQETWYKIQARLALAQNVGQHRQQHSRYALQGIIWCAQCNVRMHGHDRGPKGKYYGCPTCHVERGLVKVERAVRSCLEHIVLDSVEVARVKADMADQAGALQSELAALAERRRELHGKRMRAYDRWDEGRIDEAQYHAQIAAIDEQLASVARSENETKARVASLPAQSALVADIASRRAEWLYWPDKIPAMDIEQQQRAYRECCGKVILDRGSNTLTVQYSAHLAPLARAPVRTVPL